MKLLWILLLASVCVKTHAEEIELGDSDFESELEKHDIALVMFYAPWCGHCKRLKPEFTKAASDLAKNDPPVALAKVDCTAEGKDTCGRFGVSGYPTLKIFRNGEFSQEYSGPREAAGITKFMRGQAGPAAVELKDQAALDKFLSKDEVTIVSFLTSSSEVDTFKKVAAALRESATFGHFSGSSAPEGQQGIVLNRPKHLQSKLEESKLNFEGSVSTDELKNWVKDNYHGLVGHRTFDNAAEFQDPLVVAYYDVDYVKNVKGTNYWRNRLMKVAKGFPKLRFAVSNKDDFMQETSEFGLSTVGKDKPVVAIKAKGGKKFVMEEEFSVDALQQFLDSFEAGKVQPYVKSEPVPEPNEKGVKVAVAKNFEQLVEESDKDVLIEFYAPWCGHCKKLAPTYDELGEKMLNEEVEIVKMDATANDVPEKFNVQGFPTLFWVPAKTKKPESYQGGRELDDFVKFIAKNAGKELKGFDRKGKVKKTEL